MPRDRAKQGLEAEWCKMVLAMNKTIYSDSAMQLEKLLTKYRIEPYVMINTEKRKFKLSYNLKINSSLTDSNLVLYSISDVRKCHFRTRRKHLPFSYLTVIVHTNSTPSKHGHFHE